jgi:serine/threonine protein kinase
MASPADIVRQKIQPGDRIGGRYEIERFVGAGAYGAIFSAIDVESMERVAVKALPPATHAGVNKTAVGRFEREMQVIARLRHPNIITLYDFGQTPSGMTYMVIEFIDGLTLFDLVTTQRLTESEAISLCEQIAMALDEAHTKGVVHRDLKPQNVMVTRGPHGYTAKVLDFGMAKLTSQGGDDMLPQLTREGMAVGTPRYIAPEQARGKQVGAWSDIYALGLLFYEMFTGERAVKADTVESAIIAHVSPEPLALDEIDRVPPRIRPILMKMIEKKVAKRYQSAADVIRDLRELEADTLAIDLERTVPVGMHALHVRPQSAAPAAPAVSPGMAPGMPHQMAGGTPNSPEKLELDYNRFEQFAPVQQFKAPPKIQTLREEKADFRAPMNIFEWVEAVAAFVVFPLGFILLTAQMEGLHPALRWAVGMLPPVVALAVSTSTRSPSWNLSLFRVLFANSLLWVVAAHVFGLERLAANLLRNPAWFLRPFADAPVLGALFDLVAAFSRAYGQMLT